MDLMTPESARSSSLIATPSSAITSYGFDLDEDFETIERIEARLGRAAEHIEVLEAYRQVKSVLSSKQNPTISLIVSQLRRMGGYNSVSPFSFSLDTTPPASHWKGRLIIDEDREEDGNDTDTHQDQFSRKSTRPIIPALKMKSLTIDDSSSSEPEPQSFLSPHSIWTLLRVLLPERQKRSPSLTPCAQLARSDPSPNPNPNPGLVTSHPINLWDEEEEGEEELPMLPDSWWCIIDLVSCSDKSFVSTLPDRISFGRQIAHTHYSTVFFGILRSGADLKLKDVVVKRMDISDESSKANIVAELIALRQLNGGGRGIAVRLLDFCITDNGKTALIVLDQHQGNLRSWAQLEQRSIEEKLTAFLRICSLVSSLHQANLAHCDLKLDNLLIQNDDATNIVLCDFSECCSISFVSETLLNESRGTECYISPELHKGMPTLPFAMDCWSLGCLFYELVTNQLLFPGKGDCLLPSLGGSEGWPSRGSKEASIFESQFKSADQAGKALCLLQSILQPESGRLNSEEIFKRATQLLAMKDDKAVISRGALKESNCVNSNQMQSFDQP